MFTQANPSPVYRELLTSYRSMHANGYTRMVDGKEITVTPDKAFPGDQLPHYLHPIKEMIVTTGARTLLDYGCGKGQQYKMGPLKDQNGRFMAKDVQDFWGVENIRLYDPGVPQYDAYPSEEFDGVISTDVLEHIPRDDVFWVVEEMVSRARKFIFANIACYPALALLPNGMNAHVTVEHPRWWAGLFESAARRKENLKIMLVCLGDATAADGARYRASVTMNLQ